LFPPCQGQQQPFGFPQKTLAFSKFLFKNTPLYRKTVVLL
jgi:hypothetical protein